MRSDRSFSSFSSALFWENIKRFWLLALAGFALYFLCAPFSMLAQLDNMQVSLVRELLNNHNIGFLFFNVLMPLVSAVAVFSYLNSTGSVNLLHSMPFSRRTLYVSNFLSGLALAEAPFLINALIVLALKRPVMSGYYSYEQEISQYVEYDIYTYPAIGKWILVSMVTILFIYAVAVLGMMVSGNTVIGFLTAGAFNFLAAALLLCGYAYASMFLYGYYENGEIMELAVKTNPVLFFAVRGNGIPALVPMLLYLLASVLAFMLGYFAYTRRKLERAGESYVFRFMQHVVCFLLTFFAATVVGLLFNSIFGMGDSINYTGLFLGGLIGFLIARMIVKTSPRIFNLDSLKTFAAYAVIIALIVAAFAFDVFGYAKWQPRQSDILQANIWNPCIAQNGKADTDFFDPENIGLVEAFQQEIVAARGEEITAGTSVQLSYVLKNGRVVRRGYNVNTDRILNSEILRMLYESEEMRGKAEAVTQLDVDKIDVRVEDVFGSAERYSAACSRLSEQDIKSLLEAAAADIRSRSYADLTSNQAAIAVINLELRYDEPLSSQNGGSKYSAVPGYQYSTAVTDRSLISSSKPKDTVEYIAMFSYMVDRTTENTLAWMNAHGMATDSSVFEGCVMQVFNFNDSNEHYYTPKEYGLDESIPQLMDTRWDSILTIPESDALRIVVDDPEKIAELWFDYSCDFRNQAVPVDDTRCFTIYRMVPEGGEIRYSPDLFAYININNIPSWLKAEMDRYF